MDIEKYAHNICLKLVDNKFFDEQGVVFEGIKTQRELLIKRLNWWINNMEGDIKNEAPMTATLLGQSVMKFFDAQNEKEPIENYL